MFLYHRHFALPLHHHLSLWGKEMIEYYLFATLWLMGNFGANLLLPLLLFTRDFSLHEILIVFLVNEIWLMVFATGAAELLKRFGLKPILVTGALFFAVFLMILGRNADTITIGLLFGLLAIRAFGKVLLSFGHEVFMIKVATAQNTAKSLTWVRICVILASVLSPAIIAMVAHQFGYGLGFQIAGMLVAISLLPLSLAPNHHFEINYKPANVLGMMQKRLNKRYLLAETGRIFPDAIIFMIWPVFLFYVVGNVGAVGIVTSISALFAIIVAHLIGRFIEKHKEDKTVFLGSVHAAVCFHFVRALFPIPIVITIIDCFGRICDSALQIAYETRCYRYLHTLPEEDLIEIAHARIFLLEFIYLIAIITLLTITSFFETLTPELFLIIFGISSMFFLFMRNILVLEQPEPLLCDVPRRRWWRFWQRSW